METIIAFEVDHGGEIRRVQLSASEVAAPKPSVELVWSVSTADNEAAPRHEVRIQIDLQQRDIQIQGLLGLSSIEACLAACAVAGLMGPLVECYNPNRKRYIACLRSKGKAVGADVLKCAIGCGGGAIGAGAP